MRLEYRKLGSMSFAEYCVLVLFILLVLLWFTRDPGFIPGWASLLLNQKKMCVLSINDKILGSPALPLSYGVSVLLSLYCSSSITYKIRTTKNIVINHSCFVL